MNARVGVCVLAVLLILAPISFDGSGFFGFQTQYASAVSNRIVVWNFDEPSGTTAFDASGNGNNGTLYNSPTRISGGGYTFNGTSQYVRSTNAVSGSLGVVDQAYTLAAKIRIAAGETNGNIVHVSSTSTGSAGWCTPLLSLVDGKIKADSWADGDVSSAISPSTASEGQWYAIATTWDPDSDLLKLYIDGELVASTPQTTYHAAGEPVYIFPAIGLVGTCANDVGYFKGDIKDVVVSASALSQSEIQTLAASDATTIYANSSTGNDSTGDGTSGSPFKTFHQSFLTAHHGDTIDLTGTFTWTDAAEAGDVTQNGYVLSKDLTITGQSASTTIVQAHIASSTTDRRVFTVSRGTTIDFSNLSLQNGNTTSDGGGVLVYGTSTMEYMDIYNNRSSSNNGGGVSVFGALTIRNSTVRNNASYYQGGGLLRSYYGGDGTSAPNASERLDIINTTVVSNRVMSSVAYTEGGGVYYRRGNGSITNSTIAHNRVVNGGVSVSTHGIGTGEVSVEVSLQNSIIANNYLSTSGGDIGHRSTSNGTYTDNGGNIIGRLGYYKSGYTASTSTWIDATANNIAIDGAYVLQDGGGATSGELFLDTAEADNGSANGTQTLALTDVDSIARNNGVDTDNGNITVPTSDQRGVSRVGVVDIGAYEYDGAGSEPPDETAPVISSVSVESVATTTAALLWTTDEAASTKAAYSIDTSYSSTTTEADVDTRVTSHTASLSGLSQCTTYNVQTVSRDAAGNTATSTRQTFTTIGCAGNATVLSATSSVVAVDSIATTTLSYSTSTLSVITPADFTATSSEVVIQIRAFSAGTTLAGIGSPSGMTRATDTVFDVTALVGDGEPLDSFDVPVTITHTYSDEEIVGLDESTLWLYHYHNELWERLDDCSLNTDTNTLTCTAPSFSIFAIFGTGTQSSSDTGVSTSSTSTRGTSIKARVDNL
ncbi:LamG domain-containing protein, partial [Patescibacteria group bacterium]|nr:LamG domain-containing protein [Patescibacteria group bacterium]